MQKFMSTLRALTSRGLAGVLVATAAVGLALAGGTAAQAEPQQPNGKVSVQSTDHNGLCEVGELCLYYNSNCQGSFIDFGGPVNDFAGYTFLSNGAGKGQPVKNNAASARNRDTVWTARIWFNSGYHGSHDDIPPSTNCRNLSNTYNENASLDWYIA